MITRYILCGAVFCTLVGYMLRLRRTKGWNKWPDIIGFLCSLASGLALVATIPEDFLGHIPFRINWDVILSTTVIIGLLYALPLWQLGNELRHIKKMTS